ncbi:MAG TPA: tetratricopeptide repeat protein [Geothrix sp.]|jgi:tetratricopeptide (TPR) repeat protein
MILFLSPISIQAAPAPGEAEMGRLLTQARQARNQSRWEEAIKGYDALLAKDAWHETALFERAQTLGWARRYPDCVAAWRLFRERAPWRAREADQNLAMMASWGRIFDVSLATLEPYVQKEERWAVLDSAKYLSWAGRYRESLARSSRWITAHPEDKDALLMHARVLSWDGRLKEAHGAFERLVARFPDLADARMGLTQVSLWSGRVEEARVAWDQVPKETRETPEGKLLEGQIQLAEGHRRSALAQLKPLARQGSSVQRDAEDLIRAAAEGNGPVVEIGQSRTLTSEPLRMLDSSVRARVPLGDGSIGLSHVLHHSELSGLESDAHETAASLAYPLGPLRLSAEAGRITGLGGDPAGFHRLGVLWRLGHGAELNLVQGRSVIVFTPQAVAQRVGMQSTDLAFTLAGFADVLRLQGGTASVSAGNRRSTWSAAYEHRWRVSPVTFTTGLTSRSMGYSETLPLGFWNPNRYLFHGVTGGASFEHGRFAFGVEGRWGRQVTDQQAWTTGKGYGANLSWGLGRSPVTLLLGWSQSTSGLNAVSVSDPDAYREQTFRWGLRVAGPWRW